MIPERITPRVLYDMARRRRLALLAPLALAVVAAGLLALATPRLYKSEATIMVQGPEVPAGYVQPTVVTFNLEDRLRAMAQQVTGRATLLSLARQFALYPELAGRPAEDLLERMRDDLSVELGDKSDLSDKERRGGREVVCFKLSYAHRRPATAQAVTARLASLFIEENLRARARQARLTTGLLERELAAARARLEAQEEALSDYKGRHLGELPEQLAANLSVLGRLQTELQTNQVALSAAQERALLVERAAADFSQAQLARNPNSALPPPTLFAGPPEARLAALRQSLPALEARYTAHHPAVVKTRHEIGRLEAELAGGKTGAAGHPLPGWAAPQGDLGAQLAAARADIARLKGEQGLILGKVGFYQQRVEATPEREQALAALSRDDDTLQANYESLLKKRAEARMAESLEDHQKGDQLRIIDPPNLPERPFKPKPLRLLLVALVLGLAGGCGLVFALEAGDHTFRRREEVEDYLQLDVLASVPLLSSQAEARRRRRRRWWLAGGACALALLLGGGLFVHLGQDQQSPPTVVSQPRVQRGCSDVR